MGGTRLVLLEKSLPEDSSCSGQNQWFCNSTSLKRAARHLSRFYDARLAEIGLRGTQFAILYVVSLRGPSAINLLAEGLVMDRSTLGHNLRPMQRDGLVELLPAAGDRRSRVVSLTDAGREKVEVGEGIWKLAQAAFEAEFGSVEAGEMRSMMDRVVATRLD